jgi:spermidine synthase
MITEEYSVMRSRIKGTIWSIRFHVFVSGAVVMALELVGSRLLAPTYGDSIYVWGSLIGIVMTSLSIGYYVGGKLADNQPNFLTFSIIILSAGIFILLIPSSSSFILEIVYYSGLGDRIGPILSSALILALPTTLLGMVSPYSIKLSTDNIVKLGGISGSLYSISTAGSIFGTFFTVFVLIPNFNVRSIILSLGIVLVVASILGLSWGLRVLSVLTIVVLTTPPAFIGGTIGIVEGTIVYQEDSPYNTLTVVDDEIGVRTLYLNNLPHSAMFLNGSNKAVFKYTDYFNLAMVFNNKIDNVLFIGGGGFSGPKQFLEYYNDITVDVVEIDSKVVKVAADYFNLSDDPRLKVFVDDGRAFLKKADNYDLIVLDAYSKTYVPFHLMTIEFFEELKEHLKPNGILVSNLISSMIGDTSHLLRAEYKTINQVYPQIYLFSTKSSSLSTVQNIILIATTTSNRYSIENLNVKTENVPTESNTLREYVKTLIEIDMENEQLPLLQDDFAPVLSLLNPVTQTPYQGGDAMKIRSSLDPIILGGIWLLALSSIFIISKKAI